MDNKKATLELGTKPVGKLLLQYAMPAIVAMVASSLYNMVDSIFIGQGVGPLAISGLAITFPFMNLSGAIGACIGVGASTYLSVKLGQKDYSTAVQILGTSVVLNIITGILFGAICLLFLDPILYFFGATDNTIPYARDYMVIILLGNVFTHLYFGMNALLRAASKPRHAMYATTFTVLLNTLLDPLFIYTFDMGIRGAALATIMSQMTALCWQLWLFSNPNELLHFKRGIYKLDGTIIKKILAIGVSPFSMNACACIVVIFINTGKVDDKPEIKEKYFTIIESEANHLLTLVNKLLTISKLENKKLILNKQTVNLEPIIEDLIEKAVRGIRINMIAFPLIGSQAVITNFFQSIGKAKASIFLSLSRQMIYLLPLLVVLPPVFGVDGVWAALPVSDAVAFVTAWFVMYRFMRKFKQQG